MNPSDRIDELIAKRTDWRGRTLAGIRQCILEADREMVENGSGWQARSGPTMASSRSPTPQSQGEAYVFAWRQPSGPRSALQRRSRGEDVASHRFLRWR